MQANNLFNKTIEKRKKYDISVIISVYNVETYLEACIKSVLCQSKTNIEIICVDDNSSDSSLEVLTKLASEDNRIHIIKNQENRGLLYVRKCGVMASEGKYIMFLDGDDYYSKDACEVAYAGIEKNKADILQFGMNVINAGNAPQFEVDSLSDFEQPFEGKIHGQDIIKICFEEEKYNYNLVNKIFNANLCKYAYAQLDNGYYCMAEDLLTYFVLSFFAESYVGIPEKLYNYNFAIGISKPGQLNLEGLERRCCGAESVKAIKRFLENQGKFYVYELLYKKIERRILSDNFDAWYYRLPFEYREGGYIIFEKYWGKDKVILGLLYDIENKQYDIDQKTRKLEEKEQTIKNKSQEIEMLKCVQLQQMSDLSEKVQIIESLKVDKQIVQKEYDHILRSLSYRIGRFMTWVPRKIMRRVRKLNKRKVSE